MSQTKFHQTIGRVFTFLLIIPLVFNLLISPLGVSPVYAIDTPVPLSPSNGTITTVLNYPPLGIPEVTWTQVVGATSYRIQFSRDIGFSNIRWNATTPNLSYTPTNAS